MISLGCGGFIEDERANKIIYDHINSWLLDILKEEFEQVGYNRFEDIDEKDEELTDYMSTHLPEGYPKEKVNYIATAVYAQILSPHEATLTTTMEYFLISCMNMYAARCDILGISSDRRIAEDREYVVEKMREELIQEEIGDSIEDADKAVSRFENIEDVQEYCVEDYDYMFLDELTEDQLYFMLGEKDTMERTDGSVIKFVVSQDWLNKD